MKTSTRLIILLMVMVGAVMLIGGYFILRQREDALETAMHHEVRAHALTLQLALEGLYRAGRLQEAQQLIDDLSENPRVYGVVLFSGEGRVAMVSSPLVADEVKYPAEVNHVIATGETAEVVREIGSQEVFSIILPVRVNGERKGAFEIAQPREFINADFARARQEIALITLLLFGTIILVVALVTRHSLLRPIKELLRGATALGRGELDYRVIVSAGGSEFTRLASEFNSMADKLAAQRKSAEREAERRLQLERELRHNERLAGLGRLAAGVAHELGTPLNVIDLRAEQTLDENCDAACRGSHIAIIRTQVERISRIVRQLLNLARPYQLKRQPVTAQRLIDGVLELIEAEALRCRVEIAVEAAPDLQFEVDSELIHQVLLNVCRNGLQAMPQGGRLQIVCDKTLVIKNDKPFAALRVADNGTGISPEHLPHIFDPFFTTKDVGNGTGLGLAVSRRIVEEHGGWLHGENRSGGGVEFSIHLPVVEQRILPLLRNYDESAIVNR